MIIKGRGMMRMRREEENDRLGWEERTLGDDRKGRKADIKGSVNR